MSFLKTEFPWLLPPLSERFTSASLQALFPLYVGIIASLEAIAGLVRDLQPHGALAALYLLEFPFYARDSGSEFKDGLCPFPLQEVVSKMGRNLPLAQTLVDVICSDKTSILVFNACVHLLCCFTKGGQKLPVFRRIDNVYPRLLNALVNCFRRTPLATIPIELVVSTLQLCTLNPEMRNQGAGYTAELQKHLAIALKDHPNLYQIAHIRKDFLQDLLLVLPMPASSSVSERTREARKEAAI